MNIPSFASFFNPISQEHNSLEKFWELTAGEQIQTLVLTSAATAVALPLLGINALPFTALGGMATFRALTRKFSVKKLNDHAASDLLFPVAKQAERVSFRTTGVEKDVTEARSSFEYKQSQNVAPKPLQKAEGTRKTTPLHKAASMLIFRGNEDQQERNLVEIKRLAHADTVNLPDENGNTPLHLIAEVSYWRDSYHGEIVRTLLTAGAKVDLANDKGRSVLHTLMYYGCYCEETVNDLVKKGADVNAQDGEGKTPLHLLFIDNRRGLHHVVHDRLYKVLVQHGAKTTTADSKGNTPLHEAINSRCDFEDLAFLLDNGAEVHVSNSYGDSPLHLLASLNDCDMAQHRKAVKLLLERGADKNAKNLKGQLPLDKAYARYVNKDHARERSKVLDLLKPI